MTGNQLPGLAHVDGLNQFRLSQFFGFDHRLGAQNGYIWDMHNLTGDYAPVLASRPPRWTVRPVAKPNGLYCSGKWFLVDGTALTVDGQEVGQVADSEKQMQGMSGRVVIWPDKLVYTQEAGGHEGRPYAEAQSHGSRRADVGIGPYGSGETGHGAETEQSGLCDDEEETA